MKGRAVLDAAKGFLTFLVKTALFPLIWLWALGLARRHSDTDSQARTKVLAAIGAGVLLAGGAFFMLYTFQEDSTDNMYGALEGRLSVAVGESEYQDQSGLAIAKAGTIEVLEAKKTEAEAQGDTENATVFGTALSTARMEQADALNRAAELEPNHALFMDVSAALAERDDRQVKQIIAAAPFEYEKMDSRTHRGFEIKDSAQADMADWMNFLLLPGLVGVFFAPLSIALGNILKNAWEPSDTVGFKPYPGASMGWFLFLGAFGLPALLFASWAFWDMDIRSREGQISL